MFTILVLVIT